ncbi:hypothetical protein HBB16_15405 [Pseudonocardia sp. MCCB 268]|nr:hypothetical protein [Pseudonocardia cytotoxica]
MAGIAPNKGYTTADIGGRRRSAAPHPPRLEGRLLDRQRRASTGPVLHPARSPPIGTSSVLVWGCRSPSAWSVVHLGRDRQALFPASPAGPRSGAMAWVRYQSNATLSDGAWLTAPVTWC